MNSVLRDGTVKGSINLAGLTCRSMADQEYVLEVRCARDFLVNLLTLNRRIRFTGGCLRSDPHLADISSHYETRSYAIASTTFPDACCGKCGRLQSSTLQVTRRR